MVTKTALVGSFLALWGVLAACGGSDSSGTDAPVTVDAADFDASDVDAPPCPGDLDVQDDGSGVQGAVGLPDLVISEIDPNGFIEFYNTTATAIDLSEETHQLCSPFSYSALSTLAPSTTVPAGGYATVPWPAAFTDTNAGGEVILYANGSFGDDTAILDFVCWGVNPHASRLTQAQDVGKWSGPCASTLTNGAIVRQVMTDGASAASYDTTASPVANDCSN